MQELSQNELLLSSQIFTSFLQKAQQETRLETTTQVQLDVHLMNRNKVTYLILIKLKKYIYLVFSKQNNPNKDYRIKFRRDWLSSCIPDSSLDSCKSPSNREFSPPPFLFQLLNQSNSPDVFFDEVVGADFTMDMKLLQVAS